MVKEPFLDKDTEGADDADNFKRKRRARNGTHLNRSNKSAVDGRLDQIRGSFNFGGGEFDVEKFGRKMDSDW
jgi:hypothetical protein